MAKKEASSIGEWVKKNRERHGLSIVEMAEVLGITTEFLDLIEADEIPPSPEVYTSMFNYFGVEDPKRGPIRKKIIKALSEVQIEDFFGGVMNNGTRDVFDTLTGTDRQEIINLFINSWASGDFKPRFVKKSK
jgi:transcriptional regulator with XRE-family HTH domain